MKITLALAIAAVSLAFTATPAEAAKTYSRTTAAPHCAPVYVRTCEVCRHTECRWATDHCGYRYRYEVVIVTYADHYSDGSRYTYTRTYRA